MENRVTKHLTVSWIGRDNKKAEMLMEKQAVSQHRSLFEILGNLAANTYESLVTMATSGQTLLLYKPTGLKVSSWTIHDLIQQEGPCSSNSDWLSNPNTLSHTQTHTQTHTPVDVPELSMHTFLLLLKI